MDRGARWATVRGVTERWTRLKRLSTHTRATQTALRLTVLHRCGVCRKGKVCGSSVWSTSVQHHFPSIFSCHVSPSPVTVVILTLFQTFS